MKKIVSAFSALLLLLSVASCNEDSAEFKKMENGAYMKFYTKGNSEVMPRLKDEVTFEMAQYFNDSLLFTTVGQEPMSIVLTEADFEGDVVDGLLMMHVGDSARLMVPADSVFTVMLQMDEIPEEYAGKSIYYDLKLLSVKPFETLEAERRALLDSLKAEEEAYLAPLREDPNNVVTESGIIKKKFDAYCYNTDAGNNDYEGYDAGTGKKVSTLNNNYLQLTAGNFNINSDMVRNVDLFGTTNDYMKGQDAQDITEQLLQVRTDKNKMTYRGCSSEEFLQCITSDVALGASSANNFYSNFDKISKAIVAQRTSVSGVDNDEEALNLVKFQEAYNLSSKMIQVMTEIYDRLILQTGV